MIQRFATVVLLASLLSGSALSAFDGKKEGFMVSIGAGGAAVRTDFKQEYGGWSGVGHEQTAAFATSLKIGYNFVNRYSIYLLHSASFTKHDKDPKDSMYANCMFGVGINYHLKADNATYIMSALGIGRFTNLDKTSQEDLGAAIMVGIGHEIYPNINIEGSYVGTRVDDNGVEVESDALHLTLNYYWF